MKLIIQELMGSPLSQGITPSKNTIVSAIRPHIYRHHFATGSLQVEIYDNTPTLIATSSAVNISAIGTKQFFHGYIDFPINAYLKAGIDYTVKLIATGGYSFNESAYCGWCNGFDLAKYPVESTPVNAFSYPLDLEIWELTEK